LFFDRASVGKEFVINRYRDASQNLRTTFEKIVHRAGLTMFPRPFDNMRASRANEVYRRWGEILEKQWIGHDPRVFADHYWMAMDTDFSAAAGWSASQSQEVYENSGLSPVFSPKRGQNGPM